MKAANDGSHADERPSAELYTATVIALVLYIIERSLTTVGGEDRDRNGHPIYLPKKSGMRRVRGFRSSVALPVQAIVEHQSKFGEVHSIIQIHVPPRHHGRHDSVYHVVFRGGLNAL